METAAFSVTAVVNEFPAPSQTFITRKLLGLNGAGVDISVAATRFSEKADEMGFELVPLAPWMEPLHALARGNRRSLISSVRAAAAGSGRSYGQPSTIRDRVLSAPLLASNPDIIHFEFSGIAVTYRKALSHLGRTRLAISCRGAAEQIVPRKDPRRGPLLKEVFEAADLIHCVSDDIRMTVEGLGAPPAKILVNRPAVPVSDFTELASVRATAGGHRGLRVLSIGRLHWKKGFDDSLRAVEKLSKSPLGIEYRIAGEGAEREKLSFLIDEYGLRGTAELLGTCNQDQIREQLAWADVLLLPSLSEGISNAVLEAMSSGLPVVSTICGGMREVIDDGVDGYLVDVGDVEAMVERLVALGDNPDLRHRLGDAAMRRARAEFDLSRQVRLFVDAYRSALSN